MNALIYKYFLVTLVHKQSRYDFEEFTLAQFADFLGGEAVLKKLDLRVTRAIET